jgi:hypothetical protein
MSVVNEWVRTVEIDEKLKTTDDDGTDDDHGLDHDRVLMHAPVRGVRMEACDCEIWRKWWDDY